LQENSEEEHIFLDTFETKETTQNCLSLENTNPRFLDCQNEILVDFHEELNIQVVVVPIDKFPEYMNILLDMGDKENNQYVSIDFEKDIEFEKIEQDQPTVEVRKIVKDETSMFIFAHQQDTIIDADCVFLFYQQEIFIHVLPYSFAYLLEKS
jgi:hypothetical protein